MTIHANYDLSSTEATLLTPFGVHSDVDITIQNLDDTSTVYVGSATVTTDSFGYRVDPNTAVSFVVRSQDSLYAVASDNGTSISTLSIGVN